MVGAGALQECLAEPQVQSVIAITRSRIGRSHPKLREVLQADFFAYDNVRAEFASGDACFFCFLAARLYPVFHWLAPQATTTTANLRRPLIRVAANGYPTSILHSRDINIAAATSLAADD